MVFLTIDGDEININKAQRIYVRPEATGSNSVRYVIMVAIGKKRHRLVSTGSDFRQAEFHCQAINQCHLNNRLTREQCYVS